MSCSGENREENALPAGGVLEEIHVSALRDSRAFMDTLHPALDAVLEAGALNSAHEEAVGAWVAPALAAFYQSVGDEDASVLPAGVGAQCPVFDATPGESPMYEYQEEAVVRMAATVLREGGGGMLLGLRPGRGKTRTVLETVLALHRVRQQCTSAVFPAARPTLVVCPKSTMPQWRTQIRRWLRVNEDPPRVALPGDAGDAGGDPHFFVTTVEGLQSSRALQARRFFAVIVDEAHCLRNRATSACATVAALRREFVFLLSGTPFQNHFHKDILGYIEAMGLGNGHGLRDTELLLRHYVHDLHCTRAGLTTLQHDVPADPLTQRAVSRLFANGITLCTGPDGSVRAKRISGVGTSSLLGLMQHTQMATVHPLLVCPGGTQPFAGAGAGAAGQADAPVCIDCGEPAPPVRRPCAHTRCDGCAARHPLCAACAEQAALAVHTPDVVWTVDPPERADAVRAALADMCPRPERVPADPASNRMFVRETSPGGTLLLALTSAKQAAMLDIVAAREDTTRIFVVSPFLGVLDLAAFLLDLSGVRWRRIDGSITGAEREEIRLMYDASDANPELWHTVPEYPVLLGTTGCCAQGIEVRGCTQIIKMSPVALGSEEEQIDARIQREGQCMPCTSHTLVCPRTMPVTISGVTADILTMDHFYLARHLEKAARDAEAGIASADHRQYTKQYLFEVLGTRVGQ